MLDVAIVGGGPGGLAAANAILRSRPGLQVMVFERANIRPRGANVVVMPNGVHALESINPVLARELVAADSRVGTKKMFTKDGQLVMEGAITDLEKIMEHGPAPSVAWHRLQGLLAAALPPEVVQPEVAFDSFQEGEDSVELLFAGSGGPSRARILIGCDGGQSRVRQQLLQDGPPNFMRTAIWRAVTPLPHWWPAQQGVAFFGAPPHTFLAFTLQGGMVAWQAYCPWPADQLDVIGGARRAYVQDGLTAEQEALERQGRVLHAYEGWCGLVRDLITSTDPLFITEHAQFYREPETCEVWGRGRVSLLGDAAHLATPMLAQGTSQAIEDALELGRAIGDLGPTPEALRHYESVRQPENAAVHACSVGLFKHFVAGNKDRLNELVVSVDRGFVQKRFQPLVATV